MYRGLLRNAALNAAGKPWPLQRAVPQKGLAHYPGGIPSLKEGVKCSRGFSGKSCTGEQELLALCVSLWRPLCRGGVGALKIILSVLSASVDESQLGLSHVHMSVRKGDKKLTTQWFPCPLEGFFHAGLCRCCNVSPALANVLPQHGEHRGGEKKSMNGEMKQKR